MNELDKKIDELLELLKKERERTPPAAADSAADKAVLFKKGRGQRKPIEGHPLEAKGDLYKNRYISHLCAVMLYQNTMNEGQLILLERLIAGVKAENTADDYLRMSMEITDKSVAELISGLNGDSPLKFAFALDMLVFCHLGKYGDNQTAFIADILDSLDMTAADIKYLTLFCKAILTADKPLLSAAVEVRPAYVDKNNTVYYAKLLGKNAVKTVVPTTLEEMYEIAAGEKDADFVVSYLTLDEDFTIGEHINYFAYGNSITFRNCDFSEIKWLWFQNFNKVTFEDCTFNDIDNCFDYSTFSPIIHLSDVDEAVFLRCKFRNCYEYYIRDYDNWKERGCVISCEHYTDTVIDIISCRFQNCGGINLGFHYSSSFICDGLIRLCADSVFKNCWHYNDENHSIDPDNPKRVMFGHVTKEENNTVINSARLC